MHTKADNSATLTQLEDRDSFVRRHIGPSPADVDSMLGALGFDSLDQLMKTVLPAQIQRRMEMAIGEPCNEAQMLASIRDLAGRNRVRHNMIGLGYHDTITPPVIQRNVLENPGWYTAYTPYQAEISQGRLEGMLNFQHMIADLTGLPLANASLLDEPTAAAEAMAMLRRVNRNNKNRRFIVDADCLPQSIAVLQTRAEYYDLEVLVGDAEALLEERECFGVMLQSPAVDGRVRDLAPLIAKAHERGAMVAVACDLLSLVMLTPPGEQGADVVVGSAQRFGVQPGYGGPHAAFFATREEYQRRVPGRIIGVSRDRHGNPALRMALQTREQHIRREKAMSNICTAQALLAVISGFYAVYHGPEGLRRIAARVHRLTRILDAGLKSAGAAGRHDSYFDTLFVKIDEPRRQEILAAAETAGINLRADDPAGIGISVNEATTREHVELVLSCFGATTGIEQLDASLANGTAFAVDLQRDTPMLEHDTFHSHRSETDMMRYLKRLENKDLSLTHSMISLGSCTMKLNAVAELMPVTWPEFAQIHPFAPDSQARGYRELIGELERMLCECTGYDAVSLQPNAGSQGEFAGLLAIRKYHEKRGQGGRDICLIPSSAHGTNPASAQMAGLEIVVVGCDDNGNIDLDQLRTKAEQYSDRLAALMVTYPSTHGVFEEHITEVCRTIHDNGGQVYLDGANLNALLGWSAPGEFGADVSHLNLHKTFCIPHGGGGPGVGPVCVREHLREFLPGHPLYRGAATGLGPVAGAPWGSAGILPISWAFLKLMGTRGLKRASEVAVLNANYLARSLEPGFKVLYKGRDGRVAHECIVDLRPFKEQAGITEEDVAKRLIDFGFHAPTMSWPVPGTLMIEPTESEDKAELDRFVEAMLAIRAEIRQVAEGELDADDNPLTNAPHTVAEVSASDWPHAYTRETAVWPVPSLRAHKYWAPVTRVDNVYGDRNLVCSCPPVSEYAGEADETAVNQ